MVQYLLHVIRVRQSANEFGPWVGGSIVIDTWGKKEVEVPPTGPVLDFASTIPPCTRISYQSMLTVPYYLYLPPPPPLLQ